MKTEYFAASKKSVPAKEIMTVKILDSEGVKRVYGVTAVDVCDDGFVDLQIKEHEANYETKIKQIEVETYDGRKFKTVTL